MLTHHAYYIEDSQSSAPAYIDAIRKEMQYQPGDPNMVVELVESFGIDEARALTQQATLRSTNERALFFIATSSITTEAQQALLKLFEEPQVGTVFVLLVPHGMLLPTLRSRLLEYPEKLVLERTSAQAQAFLSWPYKKRSDWIAALLKDDDDAREHVRAFFAELEGELYKKIGESADARDALRDIAHFRQYLSDKGPSLKMILEHFAATLPQTT